MGNEGTVLQEGARLGPYTIVRRLGAGGMGEVYLARDDRLEREVALKILPGEFAEDPERLALFEHEARAAAALNHPHIAVVHDVGVAGDVRYIVQELLDGRSLSEELADQSPSPRRAVAMCMEIARALAAAHEAGIVHRDLKPDNVFVGAGGHCKVLDFGLAKRSERRISSGSGGHEISRTPTAAVPSFEPMVGSVGYMAPEQVKGRAVDHRADLFAIGCVLFEMLTGKHPFRGRSTHQTLDNVLNEEAPALTDVAPHLPAQLDWIIQKCLAKDPDERYQGAQDLVVDLGQVARILTDDTRQRPRPAAGASSVPAWWVIPAVVASGLMTAAAVWLAGGDGAPPTPTEARRFFVNLPIGLQLALSDYSPLALSPDGSQLAYVAIQSGNTQIYVREMSAFEAYPIPGTEGGNHPFFSADGEWLGFFSGGKLRKVALAGGAPVTLADTSHQPRGGSWGADDTIVFASSGGSGLSRVSANGGPIEEFTTLDAAAGEVSHRWPQLLPNGAGVLFAIGSAEAASFEEATIAVHSFVSGETTRLLTGSSPRYVPTGHIVLTRAGSLHAVRFDLDELQVRGAAVPVVEGVAMRAISGAGWYAVSDTGVLAYVSGLGVANRVLVWVDRNGRESPLTTERRAFDTPRLSPDDERIAVTIQPEGGTPDVWLMNLDRGTTTRLTYEGMNGFPVWTPDGDRVTFTSNRAGPFNLYWKPADGSGDAEPLLLGDLPLYPDSWSPDGATLAFTEEHPDTVSDVWLWRSGAEGAEGRREPLMALPFTESSGTFSPDGRWLAYVSDETGRAEVYVRDVAAGARYQVSTEGGSEPRWSPVGDEIFYRLGQAVLAVEISADEPPRFGVPEPLFEGPYNVGAFGSANYDVAADGRFVMVKSQDATAPTLVNLVLDWFAELEDVGAPATR